MRLIYCTLALALMGMPAPLLAAETPSNADIAKRLRDLDRRIERLEKAEKADRAETQAERKAERKAAKGAAAASKAPTAADWRKVKIGMPEEQVRKILGEPVRTRSTAEHRIWSWHDPATKGGEVWLKDGTAERVFPPEVKK